jgi:hypothetical protein
MSSLSFSSLDIHCHGRYILCEASSPESNGLTVFYSNCSFIAGVLGSTVDLRDLQHSLNGFPTLELVMEQLEEELDTSREEELAR